MLKKTVIKVGRQKPTPVERSLSTPPPAGVFIEGAFPTRFRVLGCSSLGIVVTWSSLHLLRTDPE